MKNHLLNKNSSEFRPSWYLALLVYPAIVALMFIVAGDSKDQPSNQAQGQPGLATPAHAGLETLAATAVQLAQLDHAPVLLSSAAQDSNLPGASIAAYGN